VIEPLEKALADIASRHADKRLRVFDVTILAADSTSARLGGRVLENADLGEIRAALPGIRFDTSAVRVLRKPTPDVRYVATNLTDLHKEPSFLAEMLTQVLNGAELEILEEQEKWCFVRQLDGYLGWVHKPFLTSTKAPAPTHRIIEPSSLVFAEPAASDSPATRLLAGAAVRVVESRSNFSRVEFCGNPLAGAWVSSPALRPIGEPYSESQARPQLVSDAKRFFGVYYLWGGNSAWGTDCSGLTQLVHRINGYTIPRDCDLQFAAGKPVDPPYKPGDVFYFFHGEGAKRKVGHTGLCTGGWNMIHSSRGRNGVYEEDVQANENLRTTFAGARSFL